MSRELSRITLEITAVRIERLQDISEADALAEGVSPQYSHPHYNVLGRDGLNVSIGENYVHGIPKAGDDWQGIKVEYVQHVPSKQLTTAGEEYQSLWDRINGSGSWASNPWVWAITFNVLAP
jgi:hypothetical protein